MVLVPTPMLAQTPGTRSVATSTQRFADPEFQAVLLDPTTLIARVGDQPVLAGDLLPVVNQMLQQYEAKLTPRELDKQRALAIRQLLPRKIDEKLTYLDFLRTVPADKQGEVLANISKQVDKQFYEMVVDKLMERFEAKSLAELETKLRAFGSSIKRQKLSFKEQQISQFMRAHQVEETPEITYDELLKYYQDHASDFSFQAKARWEKLTALFSRFPSKPAAEQAIVEMGNQVLMGKPFAVVAKSLSQGTNAIDGGYHDWTTQGSLVSTVLDHAVFTLPVGQLSRILEDERGFHILRVIERHAAGRTSFADAQDKIRATLMEAQRKQIMADYVQRLRRDTYVWTIFDEKP